MSNADYLRNCTALTDQVVHLHGDFGTDEVYFTERIKDEYGNPLDANIRAAMILTIWEEYLAMRFFVRTCGSKTLWPPHCKRSEQLCRWR